MQKRIVLIAAIAAGLAFGANAVDLTVAAGSPKTMTAADSAVLYGAVTVNDDLTLDGAGIAITNTSAITIGAAATRPVTVTITNGAQWVTKSSQSVTFGGKGGTLVISSPTPPGWGWGTKINTAIGDNIYSGAFATMGIYMDVKVGSDAVAESGVMDVARLLTNGTASFRSIQNSNAGVAARVLFEGGLFHILYNTTTRFQVSNGARIILESVDGNQIYVRGSSGSHTLFSGTGTLETRGDGDCVFFMSDNPPTTISLQRSDTGSVVWGHRGCTIFKGYSVWKVMTDDILPFGPQTGPVVFQLDSTSNYADTRPTQLDLNGKTVTVNGLLKGIGWYSAFHFVTNSANTVATIKLNVATNALLSGLLSANFAANAANIRIQKIGAGTLTIDRTVPGDLDIAEGGCILSVDDPTPGGTFTVGDGARMLVGSDVVPALVVADRRTYSHIASIDGGGGLTKIGSNTVQCINGSALAATRLHVTSGTFAVVSGTCRTEPFWRMTLKGTLPDRTDVIHLTGINLIGLNGAIVSSGITNVTDGTPPAQLPPSSCCSPILPAGATYGTYGSGNPYHGISGLFMNGNDVVGWTPGASLNDESTWKQFWFRLKNNAEVFGYTLKTYYWANRYVPTVMAWKLECSHTGEDGTWTTVDDKVTTMDEQLASITSGGSNANPRGVYNWGVPWVLTGGLLPDTAVFNNTGMVRVDAGARLDLVAVADANLSISNLVVDVATGGGTITKFRPAANGVLDLTSLDGDLPGRYEVQLELSSVVDAARFATWRVTVNGVPSPATTLAWDNGILVAITCRGTIISFR